MMRPSWARARGIGRRRAGRGMRRPRDRRRKKPAARREDPHVGGHPVQHHQCPRACASSRSCRARSTRLRRWAIPRYPSDPAGVRRQRRSSSARFATVGRRRRQCGCSRKRASRPRSKATARSSRSRTVRPTYSSALTRRLERSGAMLRCQTRHLKSNGWPPSLAEAFFSTVRLPDSTVTCRRLIVAVGGPRIRAAAPPAMAIRSRGDSAIRLSSRDPRWCRSASRRTGFRA